MTWLRTPGPGWHCFGQEGRSLCGLWRVVFALPPPNTIGKRWSRSDIVCRGCKRREKDLTAAG